LSRLRLLGRSPPPSAPLKAFFNSTWLPLPGGALRLRVLCRSCFSAPRSPPAGCSAAALLPAAAPLPSAAGWLASASLLRLSTPGLALLLALRLRLLFLSLERCLSLRSRFSFCRQCSSQPHQISAALAGVLKGARGTNQRGRSGGGGVAPQEGAPTHTAWGDQAWLRVSALPRG